MSALMAGKVAVVTGAGRGIGRAVAHEFARAGAAVVVNNRSPEPADTVAAEIVAMGGQAVAHSGDVADFAVAAGLIAMAVERFGRLDALVNNAGALRDRMLVNMTEEDWDEAVRINLRGTFAPLQAAARHWRAAGTGGAILNMSSEAGLYHNVGQANYGAAKAAVLNLTVSAAVEFARYGITVNAIAPVAATRMSEHLIPAENRRAGQFDRYEPETIALPIVWLASERARAITGRAYDIHGDRIYVAESWRRGPTIETALPWTVETLGDDLLRLHREAQPNCGLSGIPGPVPG
ncbi:SDR family NAD(P)-dependent oxidoreductase [Novosphingobium bradum]|uniref:SDR family NAD(P)-dependent oxidoreductase n=1 Tax=Novosphingobium bradum TaxID=1737444 RepID=A0ABV7IPQ9_9SPHN